MQAEKRLEATAKAKNLHMRVEYMDDEEKRIPIKPYFKYQLAGFYGVCHTTFISWIRPFESKLIPLGYRRNQKILTVEQVKVVFECLGEP